MSTPLVPPRPSRSNAPGSSTKDSLPEVPARPLRKLDPSPNRSPLNDLPNAIGTMPKKRSQTNLSTPEVPLRPSIQTIPSIGQEGNEYASFDVLPAEAQISQADAPEQTRNVSASMPLHAPRASLASSTAKSRIETVTSTDSTQAAAAGIGKAKPKDDVHKAPADSADSLSRVSNKAEEVKRAPSADMHFRSGSGMNNSSPSLHPVTSRPGSMFNEGNHEQGIPEIGMQIPLNRFAGDVQAPSPAPTQSQFAPGIGFFNDGSARAHVRRKSSRQEFGPPDSYGLHSHGQQPHDQFERDWVAKHPKEAASESLNAYGTPRPETALTSDQLNRLVSNTSDIGMGSNAQMIGTPGEEIAWGATDEYTTRITTPKPSPLPTSERRKRSSGENNMPSAQSPLRKTSYGFPERRISNDAVEDDEVIHVNDPERNWNKVTGGGAADGGLDLGPRGGNTAQRGGWYEEQGYGTPILASDEVLKRPGSAYMQPAVDPEAADHHDYDSEGYDNSRGNSRRNSVRVPSRPSSRPNSMHGEYLGGNLHRFISHDEYQHSGVHTPLEEIEEYEPLIPEGEEESPKPKSKSKLKRPGLEHHHFPSQDVWEDTPSSLQYLTTVETPEPALQARAAPPAASKSTAFETPEQEQQRKAQNLNNMYSDNKTLLKPAVRDETRPGMHKFPSRDVWEDTPSSMMGVTTVSSPQMDETMSTPEDRPTTFGQDEGDVRATTGFTQNRRPSIPARPLRKSKLAEEMKPDDHPGPSETASRDISSATAEQPPSPEKSKPPAIPDRPKPSVPARPARSSKEAQQDGVELSKSISPEDAPPVNKPKPPVPARPAGEKIAALKAGFMNDLNNRLKLGPQAPPPKAKEAEPEVAEETTKAPLADARKGRAKGPARRKPAGSPSAMEAEPTAFSISPMIVVWEIDDTDSVQVPYSIAADDAPTETARDVPELAKEMAAIEAHNTTEPTMGEPMSPDKAVSPPPPEASYIDEVTTMDSLEQKLATAQARIGIGLSDEQDTVADDETKEPTPAPADAERSPEPTPVPEVAVTDVEQELHLTDHTAAEAKNDVSVTDHADVLEEHKGAATAKPTEEGVA